MQRQKRSIKAPTRYGFDGEQGYGYATTLTPSEYAFFQAITSPQHPTWSFIAPDLDALDEYRPFQQPFAGKMRAVKDPDLLTFDEAMRSPFRAKWMESAQAEVSGLESKNTWTEVPMSDAKTKIIPGTWVF